MPQLNKIRIVNFYYNDGNRLIADELYDFRNTESKKARNVLINLANGGGKSVLVQLMMQPILPKAKASGRRIESFFTRPGYHSYVLLEWQKDKSPEKLLTGISMRTAVNSDNGNDERGRRIQYYTFYSEYLYDYDAESITSLELSTKENGNFVAADYEYIKKLSKNHNRLVCFSQEKSREWKEKLQEFYIFPNEWEMIEKINSVESGLDTFFGEYTTSDKLIDNLIIPAIENEIRGENSGNNNEDSSLATMFMGYADLYLKNSELLKKQEIHRKYISELEPLIPEFEQLYYADDKARNAERKLYGLGDALVSRKHNLENTLSELNSATEDKNQKLEQIDYEEVSAQYYSIRKKFEEAELEKDQAYDKSEVLNQKREQISRDLKIQECADYNEKLKKAENEAEAIKMRISGLEQNSDISQEINSLKYSVHILAEKEKTFLSNSISDTEKELESQRQKQSSLKFEKDILDKQIRKCENDKSSLNGQLDQQKKQTDNLVKRYSLGIDRNIIGSYEDSQIDLLEKNLNADLSELEKEKQKTDAVIDDLKQKKDDIPNRISEIKNSVFICETEKSKIQNDIEKYEAEYDKVCSICDEYRFDYSAVFGNQLETILINMLSEKEAECIRIQNTIRIQTELKNAAENGSVHVNNEITAFLDAEKIEYITCEKYLLKQIENNNLSSESVLDLLEKYPFLAYSLIIEDEEYVKICLNDEDKWLSSTAPVFSMSEVNLFLEKSASSQKYITGCAVKLFENQNEFLSELNDKITELEKILETSESAKNHISEQYETAKAFNYSAEWLTQQNEELERIEKDIAESENRIKEFKAAQEKLKSEIEETEQNRDTISVRIQTCKNQIDSLKDIADCIQNENDLSGQIIDLSSKLTKANQQLNDTEKALEDLSDSISELETVLYQEKDKLEYAQKAYSETSPCVESPIKEGNLNDLYDQYLTLSKEQSAEIETLKKSLDYVHNNMETYQNEISRKEIDKSSYEDVVYSEQVYKKLKTELSEISLKAEKAKSDCDSANEVYIVAEHDLKNACNKLEKYGEPMPENLIYSDFEKRREDIKQEIAALNQNIKNTENLIRSADRIQDRLKDALAGLQRSEEAVAVELQENIINQFENLHKEWKDNTKSFRDLLSKAKDDLNAVINRFDKDDYKLKNSLDNLLKMMSDSKGENIFSLNDMVNKYIESAQKMVLKIEADLNGINRSRFDLSRQCTMFAEQIYNGLKHIKDARVKVYEDKSPKNMLKIDIPDSFDTDSAQKLIESEIDASVEHFANREFSNDEQKKKEAEKIVSSGRLLRTAIQKSNLTVRAYKIDKNPENASYRTWEEGLKSNSGAEKFIVYLSIILSIMNYSKSESAGIRNNSAYSVLILDNPFGSTTAPHILTPMFNLAEHFKVQMVCLTHITQNDVIKCFDFVIKAFTKKIAMSSKEILVHEINDDIPEELNHGFYGVSEQLSLI
ncbi:MAG: hypothetical protein MJ071_05515 [Oscillospiraceae bacterium]|nr:hypothetical protein [Oscillospiraceae bacterium]